MTLLAMIWVLCIKEPSTLTSLACTSRSNSCAIDNRDKRSKHDKSKSSRTGKRKEKDTAQRANTSSKFKLTNTTERQNPEGNNPTNWHDRKP